MNWFRAKGEISNGAVEGLNNKIRVVTRHRLQHMRWPLPRRGSRVRGRARQKLNALLASKLATARAWDLKETFSYFWRSYGFRTCEAMEIALYHNWADSRSQNQPTDSAEEAEKRAVKRCARQYSRRTSGTRKLYPSPAHSGEKTRSLEKSGP